MTEKKLKYLQNLEKFRDCPSSDFKEVERDAFRWTGNPVTEKDFLPVSILTPNRILDESDLKCISYGLSMFDSLVNSLNRYKSLHDKLRNHQKLQFKIEKGHIALLKLTKNDGVADEPNINNFGHFTFHEYNDTKFENKVISLYKIFLDNGEFNN